MLVLVAIQSHYQLITLALLSSIRLQGSQHLVANFSVTRVQEWGRVCDQGGEGATLSCDGDLHQPGPGLGK